MTPFSLRHRKALFEKRIKVSLGWKVRHRLWATMTLYDESYLDPGPTGLDFHSSLLEDTENDLIRLLGLGKLTLRWDGKDHESDLETYFTKGFPANALDVMEVFFGRLKNFAPGYEKKAWDFQRDANHAMSDFECPWRLSDGEFFKIDSEFLNREIVQKAEDDLREQGFGGALDEFREARDDLSGGDHKGAIQKAAQSVESILKTVTGCNGDLGKLTECFQKADFLDDIPLNKQKAIFRPIFQGLAVLRNELSGHGQGEQKINVERPYAVLAVHFAGALTQFMIDHYLRKQPSQVPEPPDLDTEPDFEEPDIPS